MTNPIPKSAENEDDIPVATTIPSVQLKLDRFSSLWWLTLLCLALAIGLVWWSLPDRGVNVTVSFPEGHGLQANDQVLYRSIDVGVVEHVELSEDLNSIVANLNLKSTATELAREGTLFWIVRPQLSLSGITGLETAVGHKYISLSPGPVDGKRIYSFEGLIDPPPLHNSRRGIEVVIRGDKRHSLRPGSVVTFRGVEVGRILSVGLSQDSRYVDVRAKVFERFQQNLTTSSRFWATSGISIDFSLGSGFQFDTESLAQGGVSFLTTSNDGEPVESGHVFRLYPKPEDEWFSAANTVSSTNIDLGGVVTLKKKWLQKGLLGKRARSSTFNGIPIRNSRGEKVVVIPYDATMFPKKAIEDSTGIVAVTTEGKKRFEKPGDAIKQFANEPLLGSISWPALSGIDWLNSKTDFREASQLENVLAARATIEDNKLTYLHYPIESSYMREDWSLPHFDGDPQLWHGSPVLAASDGKIIGILLAENTNPGIVPFSAGLFD